jgi:diguanylate cyclase (GGDEF)-like protein
MVTDGPSGGSASGGAAVASGGVTAASGVSGASPLAGEVGTACQAVVDRLAEDPCLLPSVWLERGGRLRCAARRSVWHARDGLPTIGGVVGHTFTTATETLATAGTDTLVALIDGHCPPLREGSSLAGRICVPLRCRDRVVGVLDVELRRALRPADADLVRRGAAELETRIAAHGGPPAAFPSWGLLRHIATLSQLEDLRAVADAILAAALGVGPLDSGALVRAGADGALAAVTSAGPLAGPLAATPLHGLAAHLRDGTSSFALGSPDDPRDPALAPLRAAGAHVLAVVGLVVQDELEGVLLLASRTPMVLSTDDAELLELLATHGAGALRTADLVRSLRERAATDPLTGLGHYATFHEALAGSHRRPRTAVVLCDIDGFKRLNDTFGHQHGDHVLRAVAAALSSALRRGDALFRIGGDEFAALLAVSDDTEALDAGLRLRDAVREAELGVTSSFGIAVPRDDDEADSALLARADRALYRVKGAGRDGVALAGDDPLAIAPLP